MTKLKPCPHCNAGAEIIEEELMVACNLCPVAVQDVRMSIEYLIGVLE